MKLVRDGTSMVARGGEGSPSLSGQNLYFRQENFASVGIFYSIFNFWGNILVKKIWTLYKRRRIILAVLCVTD